MTTELRKFALTTHVTSSIGWIGAVLVFLALAAVGLTSQDPQTVRGVYLVMEHAAWLTLVPLAFASLVTGCVMSLGTSWGLFRHYWVVFKLLITAFATVVLLIYMETFRQMVAGAANLATELDAVRNPSPLVHAILALAILLVATVLAIYKPQGVTPYGRRQQAAANGQELKEPSRREEEIWRVRGALGPAALKARREDQPRRCASRRVRWTRVP